MAREKLISLESVSYDESTGSTREVFDGAKATVGMIPAMYANMANVPALLDSYITGYTRFREESGFTPVEQEVIFLAISYDNNCEYCVAAHSMIADKMSGVPADVLKAIRAGEEIQDEKLAALDAFTHHMIETSGNPSKDAIAIFHSAGYTDTDVLSIVLAMSVKVLSNYSNHLFATELDAPFEDYKWSK